MRKLVYSTSLSLDGYIDSSSGDPSWVVPDEELHRHFNDIERAEVSGEKLHPTKPMLCHQGGTRIGMLVLLTALLFGCGDEPPATAPPPPPPELTPTRVLFIGNSLTFTNDVPGLVAAIGHAAGAAVTTQAVVGGSFALEDHWPNQSLQRLILDGDWDFVVLQQGPSALPESRVDLVHWTRQFDTRIRQGGARTALYMVWPDIHRMSAFDSVSVSYRAAAEAVGGVLLPAGDAWTEAWRRDPGLRLFGPDGFHPSVAGSYLAALTIFSGLTGRSALDVPLRPAEIGSLQHLSDSELEVLREAAAATVGAVPQPAARRRCCGVPLDSLHTHGAKIRQEEGPWAMGLEPITPHRPTARRATGWSRPS